MIWFILIVGLLLRSFSLNQSLWLDEAINVVATKNFSFFGILTEYAKADFHPPLYFSILWIWTKLLGYSEIIVRTPSVVLGILSIYLIYLLGKKIYSEKLGLLSAFLFAINPLHIYYSQEARMYSLATFSVLFNFLIFFNLIKDKRWNYILLICSNLLVLSSDYVAYLIFPSQLVFLLLTKQKQVLKRWVIGLLVALFVWSIWIPIFIEQLNVGYTASASLPQWKNVVGGFDLKAIPLTFVKFIIGRLTLANKIIYVSLLIPLCSFFAFLIYRGIRFIDDFNRKLLLTWLIISPALGFIISSLIPIYSYFRFLFILPSFILLSSLGLLSFPRRFKLSLFIIVLIIELTSSLLYLLNPAFHRENWKGVIKSLCCGKYEQLVIESTDVFAPLQYYTEVYPYLDGYPVIYPVGIISGLKTFPAISITDIKDLNSLINGNKIFYLEYLVDISDPNKLLQEKIKSSGFKQIKTTDFNGVGFLYEYQR